MAPALFDTNVLVYATLDQDVAKKRVAATLVMNAIAANCDTVYSEDMTDGERYGNVTVVNPFKAITP